MTSYAMRKSVILFSALVVVLPSVLLAAGVNSANLGKLERVLEHLYQAMQEVKGIAANAGAREGAAKHGLRLQGRLQLSKLDPVFRDAKLETERLQNRALVEKWRERADRANDFADLYKRDKELDDLIVEREMLKDELCVTDLYDFSGDTTDSGRKFRQYGEVRAKPDC
jgi:hypothetical protein